MKSLTLYVVVCLLAAVFAASVELTEEQKGKLETHHQECLEQENVPAEEAARVAQNDFDNATDNMKCLSTCVYEKMGILVDGALQETVAMEKMTPLYGEEKIKSAVEKCKDIKGDDRCDTGFKIFECFEKARTELV